MVVRIGGAVAAGGVLLSLLAGVGRTTLAMARDRELPHALAAVHPRHRVPHRAVRFRDDEDGAARVRDVNDGNEISPTVHVAGRWLTNPGWREVRDAITATH